MVSRLCYKLCMSITTSANINVRIPHELHQHLQQQIGASGLYDNASEYIRDLLRKDLLAKQHAWNNLSQMLAPAMHANASEYRQVSADDVIKRNKKRKSSS